jgi:predicted metal-dependent peptidase
MSVSSPPPSSEMILDRSRTALRLVCASMPWLSGLAYAVTLRVDDRVNVAAVTASGRILLNPNVFSELPMRDTVFVLAHELLHLALDTFGRKSSIDDHETVNRAHDYIINDILRQELHMSPPLGGLDLLGASEKSLEQIIAWMNENKSTQPPGCWEATAAPSTSPAKSGALSRALSDAGLLPSPSPVDSSQRLSPTSLRRLANLDVIDPDLERELYPDDQSKTEQRINDIRRVSTKALSLGELDRHLIQDVRQRGSWSGNVSIELATLRDSYAPPWELVLQHWLEGTAPGDRSYARPSRRGADRADCVLPGRTRVGWTLHIVLDTSGSMLDDLPGVLGAIATFCESSGVAEIHLVQCGDTLTADDWVRVEDIESITLFGGRSGGLSPGFERLATDPEVTAALIITDTFEEYPHQAPPFNVLWAVVRNRSFVPPYGTAILVD